MDLKDKKVAITGRLASMQRKEACALIEKGGGTFSHAVSSKTDLLVIGEDGWLFEQGKLSGKLAQAESLKAEGKRAPKIIPESEFLEYLGLKSPGKKGQGTLSAEQTANILGIPKSNLERWEQFGLVRSSSGQYAFADLVSLKTIIGLIQDGARLGDILLCLRSLSTLLKTDHPLAQARVLMESGKLLAEVEGVKFDRYGQLELCFDPEECPEQTAVDQVNNTEASDWMDYAIECEDSGRWLEAEQAYLRVIALTNWPEAHFNLAKLYEVRGRCKLAQYHLQLASNAVSDVQADAWYDLAFLYDAQGDTAKAVDLLERVISSSPWHSDACYNLALAYEKLGDNDQADNYWKKFLTFNNTLDEWAQTARQHLALHKFQKST